MSTDKEIIGNVDTFGIGYTFIKESYETEIAMYIEGKNILAFKKNEEQLTTRWNLDEVVLWLRNFLNNMKEDPYPVECTMQYAAMKESYAHEFDTEDDVAFDLYYDKLYEWEIRHCWHAASNGAILANVYFQLIGNCVEISWDNRDIEPNVKFINLIGGSIIPKEKFCAVIEKFLKVYATYWFE